MAVAHIDGDAETRKESQEELRAEAVEAERWRGLHRQALACAAAVEARSLGEAAVVETWRVKHVTACGEAAEMQAEAERWRGLHAELAAAHDETGVREATRADHKAEAEMWRNRHSEASNEAAERRAEVEHWRGLHAEAVAASGGAWEATAGDLRVDVEKWRGLHADASNEAVQQRAEAEHWRELHAEASARSCEADATVAALREEAARFQTASRSPQMPTRELTVSPGSRVPLRKQQAEPVSCCCALQGLLQFFQIALIVVADGMRAACTTTALEHDLTEDAKEEELFAAKRTRLYRFVAEEWQKCGTGTAQLLRNKETCELRILLCDNATREIVGSHRLNEHGLYHGGDNVWVWATQGCSSDDAQEANVRAVAFADAEVATTFKVAFSAAKLSNSPANPECEACERLPGLPEIEGVVDEGVHKRFHEAVELALLGLGDDGDDFACDGDDPGMERPQQSDIDYSAPPGGDGAPAGATIDGDDCSVLLIATDHVPPAQPADVVTSSVTEPAAPPPVDSFVDYGSAPATWSMDGESGCVGKQPLDGEGAALPPTTSFVDYGSAPATWSMDGESGCMGNRVVQPLDEGTIEEAPDVIYGAAPGVWPPPKCEVEGTQTFMGMLDMPQRINTASARLAEGVQTFMGGDATVVVAGG
eukprot:NODE_1944_length_2329_cov_8.761126.p1 GENE.NODE_1944_length_2329_cov_8.761126~~NODE_1944_length_2329_cov_8.761126.p1  ORF type:complete len:665 (+),score=236.21 NODE_1944_length_2329_cov_8.761126:40-1995(+)